MPQVKSDRYGDGDVLETTNSSSSSSNVSAQRAAPDQTPSRISPSSYLTNGPVLVISR